MAQSMKSLAESKADGVKKQTQFQVEPAKVKREKGFNVRGALFISPELREHIDSFKQTLRSGGVIPPLAVRVESDEVYVVDGHTRLTAIEELIAEGFEIPWISVFEFKGSDADRTAYMLTSSKGMALTPLEFGHGYLRLSRFGWSNEQIADRSGRSVANVEQLLLLAQANMDVQMMVARDKVPAHLAVELLRSHGANTGEFLKSQLERAGETGKKKVTKAVVYGPSIPREVVGRVVTSLDTFYSKLPKKQQAELQEMMSQEDDALDGKAVMIPAATLKLILSARDEVQQVYTKAAERDEKRKKKAESKAAEDAVQAA